LEKEAARREPHERFEPVENGKPGTKKPARVNHAIQSHIINGE